MYSNIWTFKGIFYEGVVTNIFGEAAVCVFGFDFAVSV